MRRSLAVMEIVAGRCGRVGDGVCVVMASTVPVMGVVVVRMRVYGAVGMTVFVLMGVRVFVFVLCTMAVRERVVVRVAVFGAVGMPMRMRVVVPVAVRLAVPVFSRMIMGVGVHRAIGVPMHVLVGMLVLVPSLMFVRVGMVVGVAVHRAVGMAMFVFMGAQRAAFDPRLAFSATTYRTHVSSLLRSAVSDANGNRSEPTLAVHEANRGALPLGSRFFLH